MLRAIFNHRALVKSLVQREFRSRSARAIWGNAWLVIQPAVMIFVYTVIFGQVMRARLPGVDDSLAYGVFLCSGIITWNFFTDIVTRCQTLFVDHADLLKTLQFPRSVLPFSMIVSASINFLIVFALFLALLAVLGRWPGAVLLATVPLLGVQVLLALGLGILTGTLNVFFRDVGQIVGVVTQIWFWLTPIVYSINVIPESIRPLFQMNPMYSIMQGYQQIIMAGVMPDWFSILPTALFALSWAMIGWAVFMQLSPDLVDEL